MAKEEATSILLAGVGGQGIIRASDILSSVLMNAGWDVKKSEVHGMAQRGGSVTSHVRYGEKVFSPVAGKGEVTFFVSFELLESLRYIDYLNHNCKVFLNDYRLPPPAVNLGVMPYPNRIDALLKAHFRYVEVINARLLAHKVGNVKTENMVLVGCLAPYLPVKHETWIDVLTQHFAPAIRDINVQAFNAGFEAATH